MHLKAGELKFQGARSHEMMNIGIGSKVRKKLCLENDRKLRGKDKSLDTELNSLEFFEVAVHGRLRRARLLGQNRRSHKAG